MLYSTQNFVSTFPTSRPARMILQICNGLLCLCFSLFLIQQQAFDFGDNPLCAAKERLSTSERDLNAQFFFGQQQEPHPAPLPGSHLLMFPTLASKATARIPKACSTNATRFQRPLFAFTSVGGWRLEVGGWWGTHGFTNTELTLKKEVDERRDQTWVRSAQITLNLCLCWTPVPLLNPPYARHPAAVIKHSFISLHPLVQFGHVIPCLSRGNLHKRPERTHLIYCVCGCVWRSKKEERNM